MAVRIFAQLSPRVAVIQKPDINRSVQVFTDELKDIEDEPSFLTYPFLVSTAGKEDLGGGTTVGITATLQNTIAAFEQRGISVSQGTATTGSSTRLIDSAATFQTDGVTLGASVINFTDQCVGTVGRVISETELEFLTDLEDGTDNDFDIGDVYKIWNIVQVEIDGGNLVAVDDVGATISAIFPTFGTQVLKTSSSSATLQELEAIEFASFNGGIFIDVDNVSGVAVGGTIVFPAGTRQQPVRDMASLHTISLARGLNKVFILGNLILNDPLIDLSKHEFIGESQNKTMITIDTLALINDAVFSNATIRGTLDGESIIKNCEIIDLTNVNGVLFNNILLGTITLGGGLVTHIINCSDGLPGLGIPTIDFNGSGQELDVRRYDGAIKLINKSGVDDVSIGMNQGRVLIDDTVTNGDIIIRGVGKVVDKNNNPIESGNFNGATIFNEVVNSEIIADAVWDEILTGATHNIPTSAGRRLRQIETAFVHANGIIAGVTNGHTFTLDVGAVATDDYYMGDRLQIIDGTGAGQSRVVISYSASRVVIVDSDFIVIPDTGSTWELDAADVNTSVSDIDLAEGFITVANSLTQVTLDTTIAVAIDNYYNGDLIVFTHGMGAGQSREIVDYTSGRLVTFSPALEVAVSTDTTFHIVAAVSAKEISKEVWDTLEADHLIANTMGKAVSDVRKVSINKMFVDKITNTLTVFDDDDITPLFVFDLEDAIGGTDIAPTDTGIFKRTPQ